MGLKRNNISLNVHTLGEMHILVNFVSFFFFAYLFSNFCICTIIAVIADSNVCCIQMKIFRLPPFYKNQVALGFELFVVQ